MSVFDPKHSKYLFLLPLLILCVIAISGIFYVHHLQAKETKPAAYIPDEVQQAPVPLHLDKAAATYIPITNVPILMYHYVEHVKNRKDTMRQKLNILPETLDKQLQTLQADGYTFLYASELADALDGKKTLPKKPIVLTFDDGYADFYTNAFPLLQKYHIKATTYIISDFIGQSNYMTVSQLQELNRSNLIEIGAHSEHHINLSEASEAKATEEITGSKTALEKLFPGQINSFAYPSGRFNQETVALVRAAGFSTAMSTLPGTQVSTQNRFTLFRLRPGSRVEKDLLNFLHVMSK